MVTNQSVLITGASTGIGRACALHMAKFGWRVFAGVRDPLDAASLREEGMQRLTPLFLDVTDPKSIKEAAELVAVSEGVTGLSGLVNNAGIPYGGPIEFLDLDEVRHVFEVNFLGVIAITQAFLPLLRLGTGRIVNVSSISGLLAAPFVSPYSASKFALEALSDSLRVELLPWNINVSIVEPGAIYTPIWDKAGGVLTDLFKRAPQMGLKLYGGAIHGMEDRFKPHGIPSVTVAHAVAHALTSRHPKTRYPIGVEGAMIRFFSGLPDRIRDRIILSKLPKWG